MDEILKSLENLNVFLAGCAITQDSDALKETFNAVRVDIMTIHGKLKGSDDVKDDKLVLGEN